MKKFLLLVISVIACFDMAYATSKTLDYEVIGIYDAQSYDVPNYFLQFSDDATAKYDSRTGNVKMGTGYLLQLDLYNEATDPASLIAGTYTAKGIAAPYAPGVYDPEYSMLTYYVNGQMVGGTKSLTSSVVVTCTDGGVYTITTSATDPVSGTPMDLTFTGRVPLSGSGDTPSAYTQLRRDLDVQLNDGGIAFYQGVTDYSNNGVTYINLYSGKYNDGGGLTTDGVNLAMMVAHKRFAKRDDFCIVPGEYQNATDLSRFTWYPCRELQYSMGGETVTMPFGSYIRVRQDGEYTYGYLKTGTFTIEVEEDRVTGTLDAYTDLGYHVTATFSGQMTLNTDNATFKSSTSNLTDDVDLDFDKLKMAHMWHTGLKGGCRTFTLDLGSPSGRDEELKDGGDILRMEFLSPQNHSVLQPGLYTVVPIRWNDYELQAGGQYEPMSLNKGYFANGGDLTGTRYAHFEENRYFVYNFIAPVEEGTVRVETSDYVNYRFEIKLVDDAGFEIRGDVEKPVEYMYDRDALAAEIEAGISNVMDDNGRRVEVVVEGDNLVVLNGGNAPVKVLDLYGRIVAEGVASNTINVATLMSDIYVVTVNNQAIKCAIR